jgi:hypothetical protein
MNTIDHLPSEGDARTMRSRNAPAVKTLVKSTVLLIVGARMVPGVVIGTANLAAMILSGWILFTVSLGVSPYCRLLWLRPWRSRFAPVPGMECLDQHRSREERARVLPSARAGAPDDAQVSASIQEAPVMGIRRGLAAGLLAGALLGSWVTAASAQAGPGDCSRATISEKLNGASIARERLQPYRYPFHDPYLATITTAMLNPDGLTPGLRRQAVHVPVLPGRNHLPSLEGRGVASVALYRQTHPAPLLFIVSGIGSSPYFGLATYYASLFHAEGFHVVILPSPMNWNFALAASRSGAPGYAPEDARDLYDLIQKTLGVLRERYSVAITGVDFMGVSLGALEGAYLSVIDADQGKIGIARYLLVNPPLDLSSALKTLDRWAALQDRFGKERSEMIRARALAIIERASSEVRNDPSAIGRLADQFSSFTTEELQFLIAQYVHTMLPELVYVTQAIHDQHVLAAGKDQVRERLEEAKSFTLMDYSEKIALPSWTRLAGEFPADSDSVNRRGSLMAILDRLRHNPRVHIMHNADDVLADPASIAELKAAMGDRMIVYPLGGHLGNLWYCTNDVAILGLFRRSPEPRTSGG